MLTFSDHGSRAHASSSMQSSSAFAELHAVERLLRAERQAHADTRQSLAAASAQLHASKRLLTKPAPLPAPASKPVQLLCLVRPASGSDAQATPVGSSKSCEAMLSCLTNEVLSIEAEQFQAVSVAEAALSSARAALTQSKERETALTDEVAAVNLQLAAARSQHATVVSTELPALRAALRSKDEEIDGLRRQLFGRASPSSDEMPEQQEQQRRQQQQQQQQQQTSTGTSPMKWEEDKAPCSPAKAFANFGVNTDEAGANVGSAPASPSFDEVDRNKAVAEAEGKALALEGEAQRRLADMQKARRVASQAAAEAEEYRMEAAAQRGEATRLKVREAELSATVERQEGQLLDTTRELKATEIARSHAVEAAERARREADKAAEELASKEEELARVSKMLEEARGERIRAEKAAAEAERAKREAASAGVKGENAAAVSALEVAAGEAAGRVSHPLLSARSFHTNRLEDDQAAAALREANARAESEAEALRVRAESIEARAAAAEARAEAAEARAKAAERRAEASSKHQKQPPLLSQSVTQEGKEQEQEEEAKGASSSARAPHPLAMLIAGQVGGGGALLKKTSEEEKEKKEATAAAPFGTIVPRNDAKATTDLEADDSSRSGVSARSLTRQVSFKLPLHKVEPPSVTSLAEQVSARAKRLQQQREQAAKDAGRPSLLSRSPKQRKAHEVDEAPRSADRDDPRKLFAALAAKEEQAAAAAAAASTTTTTIGLRTGDVPRTGVTATRVPTPRGGPQATLEPLEAGVKAPKPAELEVQRLIEIASGAASRSTPKPGAAAKLGAAATPKPLDQSTPALMDLVEVAPVRVSALELSSVGATLSTVKGDLTPMGTPMASGPVDDALTQRGNYSNSKVSPHTPTMRTPGPSRSRPRPTRISGSPYTGGLHGTLRSVASEPTPSDVASPSEAAGAMDEATPPSDESEGEGDGAEEAKQPQLPSEVARGDEGAAAQGAQDELRRAAALEVAVLFDEVDDHADEEEDEASAEPDDSELSALEEVRVGGIKEKVASANKTQQQQQPHSFLTLPSACNSDRSVPPLSCKGLGGSGLVGSGATKEHASGIGGGGAAASARAREAKEKLLAAMSEDPTAAERLAMERAAANEAAAKEAAEHKWRRRSNLLSLPGPRAVALPASALVPGCVDALSTAASMPLPETPRDQLAAASRAPLPATPADSGVSVGGRTDPNGRGVASACESVVDKENVAPAAASGKAAAAPSKKGKSKMAAGLSGIMRRRKKATAAPPAAAQSRALSPTEISHANSPGAPSSPGGGDKLFFAPSPSKRDRGLGGGGSPPGSKGGMGTARSGGTTGRSAWDTARSDKSTPTINRELRQIGGTVVKKARAVPLAPSLISANSEVVQRGGAAHFRL